MIIDVIEIVVTMMTIVNEKIIMVVEIKINAIMIH